MQTAIRYVPRHIAHHGAHAGYDRLFEFMHLQQASSGWARRLAKALPGGLAWRLWALRPQRTQAAGLNAEIGAMPFVATGKHRLCHFIYGEDTWLYTPLWKRSSNRCIATFHYPPQRLAQRINPGSVAALDAAIIVGSNQRALLSELLPAERIHLCLHPVDTDFFTPASKQHIDSEPAQSLRLVCAGNLFRDYDTLIQVHRHVRQSGFDVQTDVIGPGPAAASALKAEPGVHVLSGLDDVALRSVYRSASAGVLPLLDSTANNALLEMLSCGLPVVCSNVGGVADYTQGSAAVLMQPREATAMADQVCALLADPAARQAQGRANRLHVEQRLSYAVQAQRMREVYAQVQSQSAQAHR